MWRSIWTFRSFPPNTRRPWPNRKTYFELIDFLLSDLKLLCTAPCFKAGKIDRGRWKEHGVASSCAFASISRVMFIPDYEASKKQYHRVEEDYVVHGNHPLFYFPSNSMVGKPILCRRASRSGTRHKIHSFRRYVLL